MKQRITAEQLMELTEEQKQKLREWWKPEVGDYYTHKHDIVKCDMQTLVMAIEKFFIREDYLPLLSIGQMIELLQSKDRRNMIPEIRSKYCDGEIYCDVTLYMKDRVIGTYNFIECRPCPELADALWSAVKEVL